MEYNFPIRKQYNTLRNFIGMSFHEYIFPFFMRFSANTKKYSYFHYIFEDVCFYQIQVMGFLSSVY